MNSNNDGSLMEREAKLELLSKGMNTLMGFKEC